MVKKLSKSRASNRRGKTLFVDASTTVSLNRQDGTSASPYSTMRAALAAATTIKSVLNPTSKIEAVRAALEGEAFSLTHVDPMQAFEWGVATAKALHRRERNRLATRRKS